VYRLYQQKENKMKQEKQIMEQEKEQEKRTEKKGQSKLSKIVLVTAALMAAASLGACKQPTGGPDTEINNKGNGNGNGNGQEEENNGEGNGGKVDEPALAVMTLPAGDITNLGKNVNLLEEIDMQGIMHNSISKMDASALADSIAIAVEGLSAQAQGLEAFFGGVKNADAHADGLADKFTAIKEAEALIRRGGKTADGQPVTFGEFVSTMNSRVNALANQLREGMDDATEAEFDKYFNAYKAGHNLFTHDWAIDTGNGVGNDNTDMKAAADAYAALRDALGGIYDGSGHSINGYDDPRGFTIQGTDKCILTSGGDLALLPQMETAMVPMVVGALGLNGLTGDDATKANTAARALIIQLGQDVEELNALDIDINNVEGKDEIAFDFEQYVTVAEMATTPQTVASVEGCQAPNLRSVGEARVRYI
jgi:hypothetical protein